MKRGARDGEAGFTLVEALVAIVVLAFGLIAVTNLMVVAASSNSVANQSTAATTSASERMETLRNLPFATLAGMAGSGSLTSNIGSTGPCATTLPTASFNCTEDLPGVGVIQTRWAISIPPAGGTARLVLIQVRSEGTGVLARARSRAEFMTFRSCTDSTPSALGATPCPIPP
jgi:type IV pilus assembly protein PilV